MWNVFIERWQAFTKEQRISVGILSICGFFAVALSLFQLRASIREPFLAERAKALAFKQGLVPTDEEIEAKQRRTDTDGDGISDWDETNVFRTNPNLRDTCGDGIPDNIRIATGKNLSCGSNGNPSGILDTSGIESTSTQLLQNQVGGPNPDQIMSDFAQAALRAQSGAFGTGSSTSSTEGFIPRDPVAIRAALAGKVDQEKLDAISDEQLLQYYDMALAEQRASAAQAGSGETPSP
jgi:hypothetical protein